MSIVYQYHGDFVVHSIEQFGYIIYLVLVQQIFCELLSSEFSQFSRGRIPQTPYTHSARFRADLKLIDCSHVSPIKTPKSNIKTPFQQPQHQLFLSTAQNFIDVWIIRNLTYH